jgi:hypothetical protein
MIKLNIKPCVMPRAVRLGVRLARQTSFDLLKAHLRRCSYMHETLRSVSRYQGTADCRSPMPTSWGEEWTNQHQCSGCDMASAVGLFEEGQALTEGPLQTLVVHTETLTINTVVRSLFSREDANRLPSGCSGFPAFSISEGLSASTQVTLQIRGRDGSSPHVLSCQDTDTILDTMVSCWSPTSQWM